MPNGFEHCEAFRSCSLSLRCVVLFACALLHFCIWTFAGTANPTCSSLTCGSGTHVIDTGLVCASDPCTQAECCTVLYVISTGDDYIHHFYPNVVSKITSFTFQVMSPNDAHVLLSSQLSDASGVALYEISIGGWVNTQSVICKAKDCGTIYSTASTVGVVSGSQFKWLWVSWTGGVVAVGQGQTVGQNVFLSYTDPSPTAVNYIGVATGWGATGLWMLGQGP